MNCNYHFNSHAVMENAPLIKPQSRTLTNLDEGKEEEARKINTSHPCVSYFLSKEELAKRFPKSFN